MYVSWCSHKHRKMSKEKFITLKSTAVPLPIENIDTDQIIPARFLKATTREGFGENLFRDWRYDSEGKPKPDFVLNDPRYKGKILVAGKNFGCGSSSEHAAWALADFGFRVVVSNYFDKFLKNNEIDTAVHTLTVSDEFLMKALRKVEADSSTEITVDLENQTITLAYGTSETFDINTYKKTCLMNG